MHKLNALLLAFGAMFCLFSGLVHSDEYRELVWEELMPKGWMPPPPSYGGFGDEMIELPNEPAPTVSALNNQKIKIPGYVLPTKYDEKGVSEFLLVPYMGACIHTPPPPENQMVYVTLAEPLMTTKLWEPVWVSGVLKTEYLDSDYATAAYVIRGARSEKYVYE